jgi:CMP-N-acetylneuraminic acid synthetase
MIYYIIPARKGSKGFPGKNRKLLPFTLDSIPDQNKSSVIVSTDDEFIVDMLKNSSVKIHNRSETVSSDTASTRDLLLEVAKDFNMKAEDEIIMMYLPYPERTYDDIETIYKFFKDNDGVSLLCAEEPEIHPYRAFYALEDHKGKKIVENDLYRRQDYPKCFMASYFLAIIRVEYLHLLDKNLYHPKTLFYNLGHTIDVDSEKDLEKFIEGRK